MMAGTRCSEPVREAPRSRAPIILGALAALIGTPLAVARGGAQDARTFEFEGEYGLMVRVVPEGLDVRWLTDDVRVGELAAFVDGKEVHRVRTEEAQTHATVVESTAASVVLEYGAVDGDRYSTTIERNPPARAEIEVAGVDPVYLFGDVHGEFGRVTRLLRNAGLVDEELRWTGGERHVVFLGDLFDRGDDVTRVLWFVYGLERGAAEAGGAVHVLLGNHELMVMSGDLRYVAGKESMVAFRHGVDYADLFDPRESVLGRWLASKPGLMKVDDLLLAHGGMSPAYLAYEAPEFQDTLHAFLGEDLFLGWNDPEFLAAYGDTVTLDTAAVARRFDFFFSSESVFWYRDLVRSDTLGAFLDRVLERYDSRIHVIGHTPVETIQERYDGRLIATDLLDAATEMLLLVREDGGEWARFKVPLSGPPVPLGPAPPSADTTPPDG